MKALSTSSMAAAIAGLCLISVAAKPAHATFALNGMPSGLHPMALAFAQEGWEAPPQELDEISRKGFHDGIEGARKDFGNHRPPNPNNRDEFRHPDVPHRDRAAYRRGFERGYHVAWDHIEHDRR